MRYARVKTPQGPRFARLTGDRSAVLLSGSPWESPEELASCEWNYSDLLAPVRPGKVLCVGRNYALHAKELGNEVPKSPLLFLKPSSSVIGPSQDIVLPPESERVEHEAELAVVIGKTAKRVSVESSLSYVFGYTCGGDITARDLQKSDGQWSRAKGFDTFCPIGPWVETDLDPRNVSIECRVNDAVRQSGNTKDMVFDVPTLISAMSHAMTLEPGDVLLTGTPEGVGPLLAGDRFSIAMSGIGELRCNVSATR